MICVDSNQNGLAGLDGQNLIRVGTDKTRGRGIVRMYMLRCEYLACQDCNGSPDKCYSSLLHGGHKVRKTEQKATGNTESSPADLLEDC